VAKLDERYDSASIGPALEIEPDEATKLVLEHLRHIRSRLDKIDQGVDDVKTRLATLEVGQAGILSFIAQHDSSIAQQQLGLDRLNVRVDRIERRLELNDAP
jgi:uncharacterized coiled-coil protein SlyX